jgi:hypothetical protein
VYYEISNIPWPESFTGEAYHMLIILRLIRLKQGPTDDLLFSLEICLQRC